jgi:hypothetical protein
LKSAGPVRDRQMRRFIWPRRIYPAEPLAAWKTVRMPINGGSDL